EAVGYVEDPPGGRGDLIAPHRTADVGFNAHLQTCLPDDTKAGRQVVFRPINRTRPADAEAVQPVAKAPERLIASYDGTGVPLLCFPNDPLLLLIASKKGDCRYVNPYRLPLFGEALKVSEGPDSFHFGVFFQVVRREFAALFADEIDGLHHDRL